MPNQQHSVVIQANRLADGLSTTSTPDRAVLVQDGRIGAEGAVAAIERQAPPNAERIELAGATLGPKPPQTPAIRAERR